jgi:hypothetical protein
LIARIAIARVRANGIAALAIGTAGTEFALVNVGAAGQGIAFVAGIAFAIVGSSIAPCIGTARRLGVVGNAFAQCFIGRHVILKARLVIAHVLTNVTALSFLVKGKPIHPKAKEPTHLDGLVECLAGIAIDFATKRDGLQKQIARDNTTTTTSTTTGQLTMISIR